jgi:hypothetical protein
MEAEILVLKGSIMKRVGKRYLCTDWIGLVRGSWGIVGRVLSLVLGKD